jgi:hypothetical protein
MWSAEDIAKLDERIRETKRLLETMQKQRSNMMRDRMQFKKLIHRNRKRRQEKLNNE